MTIMVRLTIVAFCILVSSSDLGAQTRYAMFPTTQPLPTDPVVKHPASFVGLNGAAWRDAEMWIADNERIEMSLQMPEGDTVTLDVERFRVVDKNTPLYELRASGMTQVPMPASVLLRGKVRHSPTSHVMLAIFKTWATGYITLDRNGTKRRYFLSPLSQTPNSIHIVNEDVYAVHPSPWNCSTVDTDFPVGGKEKGQEQTQAVTKIIRVAIEGDEEYFIDHGRDVYKCAQYAQAVVAAVSDIYQRDISAAVNTPWMGFWVATDPFPGTNSSAILGQLRTYWLANRTTVDRSSVTLLSGVNGIGGVANLDALCTTNGFAVSGTNNNIAYPVAGYAWDTDVVSHELGHNVGARHTHSCAWSPPIDSCYAAEGTCYNGTKGKLGTIMSYCHLTTFGTELVFHSRVSAYMVNRLAARSCVLAPGTMLVGAGLDTTICTGASVRLSGSVSGGTGPYTYFWTPLIGISNPNVLTPTVNPTQNITYVLEVRDNAGKINSDTVKVIVGPPLTVSVPSTISVCTESDAIITATPTNGVGTYKYTWIYDGNTSHSDSPTLAFRPLFADTILVVCLATDSRDLCDAMDSTIVIVNRKPYASITGPTVACAGEVIMLNTTMTLGKAPYTIQWTVNDVPKVLSSDDVLLTVDTDLNIGLVITDALGCSDTTEHLVTVRDFSATVTPAVVQLPAIPPCADTASTQVVLTNTGALPITITQSNVIVLGRPLPRTIAAGAADTINVHMVNLPTGAFTDTLKFIDGACSRVFKAAVKGQRNGVRVSSQLPLVVGPFVACIDSNTVDYTFSVENGAGVPITLNLPDGQVVVPALTDSVIHRTARGVFADSITLDTLRITYSSGLCTGLLSVPLSIQSAFVNLEKPDSIAFGSVFNDVVTPTSQTFQLKSTTGSVPFIVVDSVDVSAPFSTTLKAGQRLNRGVAITSSVTLTLSQTPVLGDIRDTLRVRFSGCDDIYELPLSALVVITDVASDVLSTGAVSIVNQDGSIMIRVSDGSAFTYEIQDLQGRTLVGANAQGGAIIDTGMLATGVYAVQVQTVHGAASRLVLLAR